MALALVARAEAALLDASAPISNATDALVLLQVRAPPKSSQGMVYRQGYGLSGDRLQKQRFDRRAGGTSAPIFNATDAFVLLQAHE